MNDQQHNIFLRYLFFLFMEGCLLLSVGGTSNRIFSRLENSPSTDIIDITKDKYGFIWFASNDGIYRFDGYDVIVYSIRSEKNNRIEHEAVWTTFLDQDEQLWIAGGDAGCSRYDYESDVFLNYDSATVSGRHFMRHIKDLEQDHNGIIWAGGDNGLFYYDPEQDGFRMMDYTTDDGEPIELFNELFIDQDDVFWIGDEFGNLYNLDRTNGYITRYKKGYFKNKGTNRKIVWKILQDSRGEIWVVGEEMALSINPQSA